MDKQKRMDYLDGLKGIACLLIFAHHFLLLFYPAIHSGEFAPSYLGGIDTYLAESPLSVIFNGNFLLCLFCVISGLVISMQVMNLSDKEKFASIVAKRYFRLMLPVLPIAVIVLIFTNIGAFPVWDSGYYKGALSIEQFIKSTFIETWFYIDSTISGNLWVMSKMFFGSFLSMLLGSLAWKYKKRAWVLIVFVAICFFNHSDFYFAFTLGSLLAWMIVNKGKLFNKILGVAFLVFGLFLGGYPSGVTPTGIYKPFAFHSAVDLHIMGAGMVVYGLLSLKTAQKVLSIKPFLFLGKISYSVFISHGVLIFSLTSALYLAFKDSMDYVLLVTLIFIVSTAVLIVFCYLYNRFVEKGLNHIQYKLFKWLEAGEDK